jgi:hypothetical protein
MKKRYARPSLREYGSLQQLTQGNSGAALDFDENFNVIVDAPSCVPPVVGGQTRVFCVTRVGS